MSSIFRAARSALLILFVLAASVLAALPSSYAAPAKASSHGELIKAGATPLAKSAEVRKDAPRMKTASLGFEPFAFFQAASDSVSTFAADCTTPKTSWSLGETVCVTVSGPLDASRVLRHVQLVNPDGFVIDSLDLTTNPQTFTFTLPSDRSVTLFGMDIDNRGNWRVDLTDTSDASVRAFAPITVHDSDPARQVTDLQISKFLVGDSAATAGSNIQSLIWVFNGGPDAAQNVNITDVPPANTTFQSLTQTDGAAFNCTTPAANTSGTTVCTKSSMAKDDFAGFVITYKVNANISNGTELDSTASVSSDTAERSTANNSSDESDSATNPNPPPCTISCPNNVTQDSDPGQAGAIVNYDAPTTSGTCQPVTTDHASGSFFPIGTTTVNASAGTGVTCSFNVTVIDKRSVIVTLNGSADVTVECRTGFTDQGATATDGTNSLDVTTTVTVPDPSGATDSNGDSVQVPAPGNVVDPNSPNTYTITYTATDGNGHTGKAVRVVHVVDTAPPVITLSGTSGFTPQTETVTVTNDDGTTSTVTETILVGTVECHDGLTPPTATAFDGCDNHSVPVTTSGGVDTGTPGTYEIIFQASDASGNDTEQRVRVTVVDTKPPVISLNGSNPMTVECHTSFTDPGATAADACEGPVSVNTSGSVNPDVVGSYSITYTATDSGGRTATVVRTVNVVDTTAPLVTLNGPSSVTVECHTVYTDAGASASDSCAGSVAVSSTSDVNVNAPGTYHVVWSATDPSGNTGTATRTVTVVDTTPPVISCPANITVYLPLHTTATSMAVNYPAAAATDSCDSTPTVTYTKASGSVFNVGTTPVTATATDDSGNTASCTFTVTVLYDFTGFFSPVANPPTVNAVNAGRAIPVKFSLSGNKGLNIFAAGSPSSAPYTCGNDSTVDVSQTVDATANSINYDASADQYNYVWKTDSSWAGQCRTLTVTLNDGSTHTALFKFR